METGKSQNLLRLAATRHAALRKAADATHLSSAFRCLAQHKAAWRWLENIHQPRLLWTNLIYRAFMPPFLSSLPPRACPIATPASPAAPPPTAATLLAGVCDTLDARQAFYSCAVGRSIGHWNIDARLQRVARHVQRFASAALSEPFVAPVLV